MHPPAVFLDAAKAHNILILHAAALCYRPPPQSSPDDLSRAQAILALPSHLAGRDILLASATSQATFLCARIRALAYARTLHPLFTHIDVLSSECPSIAPLRNLHAHFSGMHAACLATHKLIDDADLSFCTFGTAFARFRPQGLPSTAASDIPLEACDPDPDIPSAMRFPTLRQFPSLDVLQGLDPTRFKGWRKTLTSIHGHCQWIALYLNAPSRSKAILISQSQPHALACATADLANPLQKIHTDVLRPAFLYHLHLPQLTTDPDGPDRHGDVSLNASDHNVPHNLVRDAHFVTAVSAYGSNSVELEPADHSLYSPGKRPDIYISELATILDAKVGRPVKASANPLISLRATHTAFALNEDDFFADSLGRSQRGTKGDSPFDPSDASGYVPAVRGEYAAALANAQTVDILVNEVTGAPHPNVRIFMRACAVAHSDRQGTSAADAPAYERSFIAKARSRLSIACLKGLGKSLLSAARRASKRRRIRPPTRILPHPVFSPLRPNRHIHNPSIPRRRHAKNRTRQ